MKKLTARHEHSYLKMHDNLVCVYRDEMLNMVEENAFFLYYAGRVKLCLYAMGFVH